MYYFVGQYNLQFLRLHPLPCLKKIEDNNNDDDDDGDDDDDDDADFF